MTSEALLGISTGKLSKDVQLPSVAPAAPDIPLSWSLEKENFDAAYIDENNVLKVNVSDVKNGGTNKLIATAAIPGGGAMTKKYSIGVPYRSEPYCASEEDMIYQENFDGKTNLSQIKGVVETAGEQGNVFLSDGKLHVKHTNSSIAEDSVSIYFRDDKGGTLGRIVLEYEVTKTNATHVSLQTVGPNNNPFLGVWNMNHYGADQTKYYTSGGTLGDWSRQEKTLSNLYFRENGPYKVTQYFDTANRKWSMWINGINVLDNIWNGQSGGVLGVAKLSVMLLSSFSMDQEVSIDNVKLYNATLAPKKAADEDTAIVKAAGWDGIKGENASQTALTAPLQFSGTLLNKNTSVVFTEPKGCINADGTINQPLYDTPTTVTANVASPTLSEGDYKGSNMKYNVTVQGKTSVGAVEYDDPAAGANSAICKIYSRTGETRDVTFVLAAYQGDQLVAIDIQPFTIAAEDPDGDANYAYAEVELAEADQNTRLRAFLFEDWESLIPAPVSLG